jgi:5-methylcytosine-specific restriction endonuclease McrA
MLEVERRLGRTLEEDFREYYVEKGWGQLRIANRWGVDRNLIFETSTRGRKRSWIEMLSLPVRRSDEQANLCDREPEQTLACEVCGEFDQYLDRAHWISAAGGGGRQSFNILRLCPNCHRKLDRDDPATTERAKETLLFREAKRVVETGQDSIAKKKEMLRICEAIIIRRTT